VGLQLLCDVVWWPIETKYGVVGWSAGRMLSDGGGDGDDDGDGGSTTRLQLG
jgi:hypothetical protein